MKRFQSILCALLLTLSISSSAFAGLMPAKSGLMPAKSGLMPAKSGLIPADPVTDIAVDIVIILINGIVVP